MIVKILVNQSAQRQPASRQLHREPGTGPCPRCCSARLRGGSGLNEEGGKCTQYAGPSAPGISAALLPSPPPTHSFLPPPGQPLQVDLSRGRQGRGVTHDSGAWIVGLSRVASNTELTCQGALTMNLLPRPGQLSGTQPGALGSLCPVLTGPQGSTGARAPVSQLRKPSSFRVLCLSPHSWHICPPLCLVS